MSHSNSQEASPLSWLKTLITRVVINIFWPHFQDMWSIVGGTSPPRYIYFWARLNFRHLSPISPVPGHFHVTHSLDINLYPLLIIKKMSLFRWKMPKLWPIYGKFNVHNEYKFMFIEVAWKWFRTCGMDGNLNLLKNGWNLEGMFLQPSYKRFNSWNVRLLTFWVGHVLFDTLYNIYYHPTM